MAKSKTKNVTEYIEDFRTRVRREYTVQQKLNYYEQKIINLEIEILRAKRRILQLKAR